MIAKKRPDRRPALLLSLMLVSFLFPAQLCSDSSGSLEGRFRLHSGWKLQSSCKVKSNGAEISAPGFPAGDWHDATVPSTGAAALVADKTFPDPYFGKNLRNIPGTSYPVGQNFSLLPMPKDSPFRCSWWYRAEFRVPANYAGRRVWLNLEGINNRANIWVNRHRIARAEDVAGAYRTYEFDVTPLVDPRKINVVAVETMAQTERDLGVNWVDWNPAPPDKDMGLWREVYLRQSGPVTIRHPQVVTHF